MKHPERSFTTLHIRNMVCDRCIRVVREELTTRGVDVRAVELGQAEVRFRHRRPGMEKVRETLQRNGLDLIDSRRLRIVEKVKTTVLDLVRRERSGNESAPRISRVVGDATGLDYHYVSSLFSSVEQITIERYAILQRVERIKELIVYDELTLSEIADRLGYSSAQHLSNQFRQVTGLTPTAFRSLRKPARTPLDRVHQTRR